MRVRCSSRFLYHKKLRIYRKIPSLTADSGNRISDRILTDSDRFSRSGYEMKGDFFT